MEISANFFTLHSILQSKVLYMNALTTNLVPNSRDYGIPCWTTQRSFCPFRELNCEELTYLQRFLGKSPDLFWDYRYVAFY